MRTTANPPKLRLTDCPIQMRRSGPPSFGDPNERGVRPSAEAAGPPAYDLRLGEGTSQRFYADVAAFSARVVDEIETRAAAALDGYARYVSDTLGEADRSRGEYGLELLTLGMALRIYSGVAAVDAGLGDRAGSRTLRDEAPVSADKPALDFLRAGLFELFMRRKAGRAGRRAGTRIKGNKLLCGASAADRVAAGDRRIQAGSATPGQLAGLPAGSWHRTRPRAGLQRQ